MEILHEQTEADGIFKAMEGGVPAGKMTYTKGTDQIIIEHTVVDEAFGGRGVGKKLVMAAVHYAREHALTIVPVCLFAKAVFDKDESLHDVLETPFP